MTGDAGTRRVQSRYPPRTDIGSCEYCTARTSTQGPHRLSHDRGRAPSAFYIRALDRKQSHCTCGTACGRSRTGRCPSLRSLGSSSAPARAGTSDASALAGAVAVGRPPGPLVVHPSPRNTARDRPRLLLDRERRSGLRSLVAFTNCPGTFPDTWPQTFPSPALLVQTPF